MNYLRVVELSAENLQFFLWYRDYEKRFNEARTPDISLAPEWTQQQQDAAIQAAHLNAIAKKNLPHEQIFKGTAFDSGVRITRSESRDPFVTPPRTPAEKSCQPWEHYSPRMSENTADYATSHTVDFRQIAADAFQTVGLKPPCQYASNLVGYFVD